MSPEKTSRSPKTGSKRVAPDHDRAISPPPIKRKAQAAISKSAVANFFTPTSKKPKDPTIWAERGPDAKLPATLLVGKYMPDNEEYQKLEASGKRCKIAAFDLDSTLITSASGKRYADDPADWKWWDNSVPRRLQQLYKEEGYRVVIFTNQGGLTLHPDSKSKNSKSTKNNRVPVFKQKCSAILSQLGIPVTLYAATGSDIYRKPRPGMWTEMKADYGLSDSDIDREHSIFVGDAGGRIAKLQGGKTLPKDFSCCDRDLAHNIGIKYQTPEEFFLGEAPREFAREFDLANFPFVEDADGEPKVERRNDKDIILFVGPPGAGKSTFYSRFLKPLGYERVNQDLLKSKDKCLKATAEFLEKGSSVVVDNTNPDPDTRAQWIALARKFKVPIRCFWFKTPLHLCEHNATVRSMNDKLNPESRQALPKLAFNGFASRFKEPKVDEGFQDLVPIDFAFRGTKEEYEIWARYWL